MSRDPRYQKLLNSKRWQMVKRIVWQRTGGLCERCIEEGKAAGVPEGWLTPGVDCHHIVPVESAKTEQEMERLAYDVSNIRLLCVACHIKTHQEMHSHCKEQVKANKQRARQRFLEANDPNYKAEDNVIQTEVHTGLIREQSTDRAYDTQAQTDIEGASGN